MKMNKLSRRLLAFVLMLLMLLPFGTAFAEPVITKSAAALRLKANSFPTDQYYEYSEDNAIYYTVQVSANNNLDAAFERANSMVAKGFDGFVYRKDGTYYVMCGKFSKAYDALCYGELIHTDPKEYDAYMNYVSLPASAANAFSSIFYSATSVDQNMDRMETYWEEPTGAYFRGDAEDAVEVYTVQFSKGTCFARSEKLRDRMERSGYPAFVIKENMTYRTLTGMFYDRSEAKAFCKEIRRNTRETDAVVKTVMVPEEEVESFLAWWNEQ